MNPDAPDDAGPAYSDGESDAHEVALLLGRYLDPTESVPDDELRDALDGLVQGTILDVTPGDAGVTVAVERAAENGDVVRETYAVRQETGLDDAPTLDWSYLGPYTEE